MTVDREDPTGFAAVAARTSVDPEPAGLSVPVPVEPAAPDTDRLTAPVSDCWAAAPEEAGRGAAAPLAAGVPASVRPAVRAPGDPAVFDGVTPDPGVADRAAPAGPPVPAGRVGPGGCGRFGAEAAEPVEPKRASAGDPGRVERPGPAPAPAHRPGPPPA
jgi:hypothetical protein